MTDQAVKELEKMGIKQPRHKAWDRCDCEDCTAYKLKLEIFQKGSEMEKNKTKSVDELLKNAEKGANKGKNGLELIKIGLLEIISQEVKRAISETLDRIEKIISHPKCDCHGEIDMKEWKSLRRGLLEEARK